MQIFLMKHVQDARLIHTLNKGWLKKANIILQANNVFNKKYEPNGYTFSYIYKESNDMMIRISRCIKNSLRNGQKNYMNKLYFSILANQFLSRKLPNGLGQSFENSVR